MLTLTFLGVGSAFAKRNLQSNALVEAWSSGPQRQSRPEDTLLIDFGGTGPLALYRLMQQPGFAYLADGGQINYGAINKVFVTHLHADHICGLEELGFIRVYASDGRRPDGSRKPLLISSAAVLENLWEHSLKGGMGTKAGGYARLEDYFSILTLNVDHGGPRRGGGGADRFVMLDRYEFIPFPTDHILVERKYDWPSFGLFIQDRRTGQAAFFSGDTKYDFAAYAPMLQQSGICFHEVQLHDQPQPVHALLSELRTLPAEIRKKTHLYHHGDDWGSEPFADVAESFAGFAVPARRYVLCE